MRQKEKRSKKFCLLHNLHSSPDIIVMMFAARNVIWARDAAPNINVYRVLILKFQTKKSFRMPKFVGGLY